MKFVDYTNSITDYFRQNGFLIDPMPKINCIKSENDLFDPFIDTGNFDAKSNTINLYVKNRQLKDILRTFSHELVHVHQFHKDPENFQTADSNLNNENTEKLEREAYELGNITFRKWTTDNKAALTESADSPKFKTTTTLICAAMRPPHKGHLELIQAYAKKSDRVIVILSNPKKEASQRKTINGNTISPEVSKKILELYIKKYSLENKVEVVISDDASPVRCATKYIDSDLSDTNIILGMSNKDDPYSRYAGVVEYYKDRSDLYFYDPKETAIPIKDDNVSASEIRDHINDFDYIKDMFPEKLSDDEKKNLINLISGNKDSNINESTVSSGSIWYIGNNKRRNFKLEQPVWWKPFYLAKTQEYASRYADYGIYKVQINSDLNILDFSNENDIKTLDVPNILKEEFKKDELDLNYVCYELFRLCRDNSIKLETLDESKRQDWLECANWFKTKIQTKDSFNKEFYDNAKNIKERMKLGDELFLFYVYYLIYKAGFIGFKRKEFKEEVLVLLSVDDMNKISIEKVFKSK